jgi:hypothetical protein
VREFLFYSDELNVIEVFDEHQVTCPCPDCDEIANKVYVNPNGNKEYPFFIVGEL